MSSISNIYIIYHRCSSIVDARRDGEGMQVTLSEDDSFQHTSFPDALQLPLPEEEINHTQISAGLFADDNIPSVDTCFDTVMKKKLENIFCCLKITVILTIEKPQ